MAPAALNNKHSVAPMEVSTEAGNAGAAEWLDDDGRPRRKGKFWTASAHIITAVVIGSGVLSLAWVAGPAAMVLFAFVTYYTATLLAKCYHTGDPETGKRSYTFMDAVRRNLCGAKFVYNFGFYQSANLVIMSATRKACSFHTQREADRCNSCTTPYMTVFAAVHVVCMLCGRIGYAAAPDNLLTGFGFFELFWLLGIAIVVHLVGAYQVFYYQAIFVFVAAAVWPDSNFISRERRVPRGSTKWICLPVAGIAIQVLCRCQPIFSSILIEIQNQITTMAPPPSESTMTVTIWHTVQAFGDIAFAYSFSNILIEIQDKIKAPPSKVTVLSVLPPACRIGRISAPTTMTTGAFNRSGMRSGRRRIGRVVPTGRSHGTPTFTPPGDCLLSLNTCDWFPIMGCVVVINTDDSCVICAAVMCMEAQYRRLSKKYHGANSCFLKVTAEAIKSLKDMCEVRGAWTPNVGAPTVEGVLDVIRSLKKGIPTVHDNIFLRLESYATFKAGELSPLKATSMLRNMATMVGVLYADGEAYFRSTVYRGGRASRPNHAVVCTDYCYIDGELFIIIMDNVEPAGPFRFVLYKAFEEFHVLTVDAS